MGVSFRLSLESYTGFRNQPLWSPPNLDHTRSTILANAAVDGQLRRTEGLASFVYCSNRISARPPLKGDPTVPILLVVILFGCVIGIALALIMLSLQRASRRVLEQFKVKLDDANLIVNEGRPPDSWVEPFRNRVEEAFSGSRQGTLRRVSPADESLERIGEQTRKRCLKRLKELIKFMEKGQFYDNEQTRETVLKSLRSEYVRWASRSGIELLMDESVESGDS